MIEIHPTAIVESKDIGNCTYIGPFTYVSSRVKIGKNCKIYNASIGLPGEHPNEHKDKGGIVVIEDNVEIREYVTISAPIFGDITYIEKGCYLMAKSHVGHDAHLKERVVLHTGATIGGHSVIGRYCYMGLNCSTHPFAKLGDYCMVGANGIYKGESPDAIVWAGVPCKPLKVNFVGLDRHGPQNNKKRIELENFAEQFISENRK